MEEGHIEHVMEWVKVEGMMVEGEASRAFRGDSKGVGR